MTDWDDGEITAWISGVGLTEPYALLLTEGLFEQAEAEAQAIAAGTPKQNRAGNASERSASPVSINEQMAERAGRPANLELALERMLETLMEPAGRQDRRRAAEAIRRSRAR